MRTPAVRRSLALIFLLSSSLAMAQDAAPPVPAWAQVETVEVQARPGPAVWHLARGDSEVWILGLSGPLPKDLDWNKQYLAELLDGAHSIILPPRGNVGILEAGWLLITYGGKLSLSHGQKLEALMPEAQRARFVEVRTALGQEAGRYETDAPIRAAMRLQQDFVIKAALNGSEPMQTINKLAHDKHVPADPAGQFEVVPMIKEVLNLSIAQQQTCLAQAVEDVDRQSHHAVAAAQAWAIGDLKTIKANISDSRLNDCMAALVHSWSNLNGQAITNLTAAIDAALDKPGKTIAVIGIANLLRKDGVLERLVARHIAIEGPAE